MATISLRDYVREIGKQVDGSRNEEAIAHSRHILESFPKHVDVYRLLGKAYLESQRYGDAGDIFQRVLSAVPEDFVSHVGMSIIREDEGNLDEAIWHMERAFDVQPSNSAIQEELRRLYGRRDNVEPPKIRLTRGSLARMYYKGELYTQAIAELRAALNESPDRLDLQSLLAEVYARTGQRVEAVDMASQVLRRLPFCLAANRIMVNMLAGTDRESEIETYYQRLCQLDPYAAHISTNAPQAEDVPDQAIRLNKLDYKASQAVEAGPGQPIWAATLGIEAAELATGREETLPEWLAAGPSTAAGESEKVESGQVPAFAVEGAQRAGEGDGELSEAITEEEQIPDWMKEMGWEPASAESQAVEAAVQFDSEPATPIFEGEPAEGELATAEIPDWLKAMAPAEALSEATSKEEGEEDIAPWLDQLFPAEQTAAELQDRETLPSMKDESVQGSEAEAQPWLEAGLALGAVAAGIAALGQEESPESGSPLETEAVFEETVDEALPAEPIVAGLLLEEQPVEALEEMEVSEPSTVEQAPDWLAEIAPEQEFGEAEAEEELPDWLRGSLAPAAGVAAAIAQPEERDEWAFEEVPPERIAGEEVSEAVAGEKVEELPDWLFESPVSASEEPVAEATPEAVEELTGWLFESEATASEETIAETTPEAAEELPTWLFESEVQASEEIPAQADAEINEDLPNWLLEATSVEGSEETLEKSAEEVEELPDWLKAAGAVAAIQADDWLSEEKEAEEGPASIPEAIEEEIIEAEPIEALLPEELPEWLREPVDVAESAEVQEFIPPVEEAEATAPAQPIEVVPSGLELVEASQPAPEENPELAEALAWLDLMLTPVKEEAEPAAPAPPAAPEETAPSAELPFDADADFAWLESLAARQGAQEALLLKPEERSEMAPEWVQQAALEAGETAQAEVAEEVEEAPAAEVTAAESPQAQATTEAPLDDEAAFAWLESLAVRQGAQDVLLLKPEDRLETPPEWVAAAAGLAAAEAQVEETLADIEAPPADLAAQAAETVEAIETPIEEVEIVAEPAAPAPPAAEVEAPPELPDWLAGPSAETREETLEWTPPPLSRRKYDLNKITLVELERLPGIGFIMAQRVIDYRNTHGPFRKIDDLLNVPEFGLAALEGIRDNLYLEIPAEPPAPAARTPTQPRPGTGPLVLATGAGLPKEVAQARNYLSEGYLDLALEIYDKLIGSKKHLSWVIEDLSEASNQYPTELYVWQSLGDAYLRSDQASQALQIYIRAEKLLLQ